MKELEAVAHVDGTARVQTVAREENPELHDLLSAFARSSGVGVLCNTSLNFKGRGFINRMSDLVRYCEQTGIEFVVGDAWFRRSS
jgi:hydroxymethyl cephem carbamoyltransferase